MLSATKRDSVLKLTRLIEWHHDRMLHPPAGCSSVVMWESVEAQRIARLTAELRPLLREAFVALSQEQIEFGAHPVDGAPSSRVA